MAEKSAASLAKVRGRIRRDRDLSEKITARIVANLKLAVELGAGAPDLAEDSGYSVSRVGQLVGGVRAVRAAAGTKAPKRRSPARPDDDDGQADDDAAAPAADPEPAPERERWQPGAVGRVGQLAHVGPKGPIVSDRWDMPREDRPTLFLDIATGAWCSPAGQHGRIPWREASAFELLSGIPEKCVRVFVVGPHRPGATPERVRTYGDGAKASRAWYLGAMPDGWSNGGHFLKDDSAMVGHWVHTSGRQLEVLRASQWFGEVTDVRAAAYAWGVLRSAVRREFGERAVLMSTPATTGRDLWRRTIPKGKEYPVLSTEVRQLIHATTPQARWELIERPASAPKDALLAEVTQYDMRVAYAALAWGMPEGLPTMVTGRMWAALDDEQQHKTLMGRGRWLVRATVPSNWAHVGILPHPADPGWEWPATPGATFTSWASGSEVALAREHGWRVDVMEGMSFKEGKPLNTWRDNIMRIHAWAGQPELAPEIRGMLKSAARMMILSSIGAFAARGHVLTHTTTDPSELPPDAPVHEVGGAYMWEQETARNEWMDRSSHPEWAAEIWGRCRARLLSSPAVGGVRTGALHVPAGTVIGLRTDGLTLAGDPGWPDDGAIGRFRRVGHARGAFQWPETDAAWSALKWTAEAALKTGEMQ